jgi:predicted nucleic acid-binding protein
MQIPGAVSIMDERLGRLQAEALNLIFTGTPGALLRAKAEGEIPRIEPLLAHLSEPRIPVSARMPEAVLRQAGE